MAMKVFRTCSASLICVVAFAGCNRSNNADLDAARAEAESFKADLAKAKVEIQSLKAELAKVKGNVDTGNTQPTKPGGLPSDHPRAGIVRDTEGKSKPFEFMQGFPPFGGDVDPKHLIFMAGNESIKVPIATLATVEIGKFSYETSRAPVVVKTKDARQQSFDADLHNVFEVKWKGDVAVNRIQWMKLQQSTIAFDK